VSRAYDGEVAVVQGYDLVDLEALGRRHHRGVNGTKWKVAVAADEFGDTKPVAAAHRFGDQIAGGEVPKEAGLGFDAEPAGQQVGHFGDDQYGDYQRTRMSFEELEGFEVVVVVGVDVGV
jgi:hypothetical protein